MTTLAIPRPRPWGFGRLVAWAKGFVSAVAAIGDGLVVGLVLAFIAFAAIGAPALFLGIPDVLAIGFVGAITAGIAFLAGALAIAVRRAIHGLTTRIRSVSFVAARPRPAGLIGIPDRILGARRWLIDVALIIYTALSIGAWLQIGAPNPQGLGYISKALEVALIVALVVHMRQARQEVPG